MPSFPLRYVVPNAITCASLTLGLVSVFQAMAGAFEEACWLVMWCVLFDKLDGSMARVLRASSSFGVQLDSFSDFVTFGLAPAFLVHALLTTPGEVGTLYLDGALFTWILRVSIVVFVLASCLRLAKFNVLTDRLGGDYFLGMPTTMAGAFIVTYILTVRKYDLPVELILVLPGIFVALALLMVANFKLPKAKVSGTLPQRVFQIANFTGVYVCGLLWIFPEYLLATGVTYMIVGAAWGAVKLRDMPGWPLPPAAPSGDDA
ncbi:MAG: CDP-diacylglycerol--serine O-phosphatidyltransferase [Myxococcales bacterium]